MDESAETRSRVTKFGIAVAALATLAGSVQGAHGSARRPAGATPPALACEPRAAELDLPLRFEANLGQANPRISYLARGQSYLLFLTPGESVFGLNTAAPSTLRLAFKNSNPAPVLSGEEALPGYSEYLADNMPAQWHRDVPSYAKVRYADLYPGIDLVYYTRKGELAYDLIVGRGADPAGIALTVSGADRLSLDANGDLLLHTPDGLIRYQAPKVYQETRTAAHLVSASYVLVNDEEVSLQVAADSVAKAPAGVELAKKPLNNFAAPKPLQARPGEGFMTKMGP